MNAKDVLIAGAGPTGLSLACGLLLHGVSVRVVDKAQGSATTSRANILHARGVEVLDRLGAFGEPGRRRARPIVRARAQPIGQLRKGGKPGPAAAGTRALITGSSAGIGEAVPKALAAEGRDAVLSRAGGASVG